MPKKYFLLLFLTAFVGGAPDDKVVKTIEEDIKSFKCGFPPESVSASCKIPYNDEAEIKYLCIGLLGATKRVCNETALRGSVFEAKQQPWEEVCKYLGQVKLEKLENDEEMLFKHFKNLTQCQLVCVDEFSGHVKPICHLMMLAYTRLQPNQGSEKTVVKADPPADNQAKPGNILPQQTEKPVIPSHSQETKVKEKVVQDIAKNSKLEDVANSPIGGLSNKKSPDASKNVDASPPQGPIQSHKKDGENGPSDSNAGQLDNNLEKSPDATKTNGDSPLQSEPTEDTALSDNVGDLRDENSPDNEDGSNEQGPKDTEPGLMTNENKNPLPPIEKGHADNTLNIIDGSSNFVGAEDSHFFVYFMCISGLCIIGYLLYHNKRKIIAMAVEGKKGRTAGRRRPISANYHKLDSNLEEAMSSNFTSTNSYVIY